MSELTVKGDHAIGRTFEAELSAYGGLLGEHFAWSPDGTIEFFDDTPAAVIAGVKLVYSAHAPDAAYGSLGQVKADQLRAVDAAADKARLTVAGDPLRAAEYQIAQAEAAAYKAIGYAGVIPPTVKSWAEAKQWTGQQAAANILAEADAWNAAIYAIRDARLKAKEAIRNALTAEAAIEIAQATIAAISADVANLGNAGGA